MMRDNRFLRLPALVLPVAVLWLTGCSRDEVPPTPDNPARSRVPMTVSATQGGVTKMNYADDGNRGYTLTWAAGDAFMLYRDGLGETFTLQAADAGSHQGDFEGTAPEVTVPVPAPAYHAIYPALRAGANWTGSTLSILGQRQAGADSKEHLAEYHYMTATVAAAAWNVADPTVSFDHRVAVLKFAILLPAGKSPRLLSLTTNSAADAALGKGIGVTEPADGTTAEGFSYVQQLSLEIVKSVNADGSTVAADFNEFTAYMTVFPSSLNQNRELLVSVESLGGDIYTYRASLMDDVDYEAGKVYDVALAAETGGLEEAFSSFDNTVAALAVPGSAPYFASQSAATPSDGTAAKPHLIATATELKKLQLLVAAGNAAYNAASYRLTADIRVTAATWTPIGSTSTNPFKGAFDGDGHTISGTLANHAASPEDFGFFGVLRGTSASAKASVSNLRIAASVDATHLDGLSALGAVAGWLHNYATVENCTVSGDVTATSSRNAACNAGGIAGYTNSSASITHCAMYGDVRGTSTTHSAYVGGIAGWNLGPVTGCSNNGSVSGSVSRSGTEGFWLYLGGITGGVGTSSGTLTACTNRGRVAVEPADTPGLLVGGIAGRTAATQVSHCHNAGPLGVKAVMGTSVGGIVGEATGGSVLSECTNAAPVTVVPSDAVIAGRIYAGGILGSNYIAGGTTVVGCTNSGTVTARGNTSGIVYAGGIAGSVAHLADCSNRGAVDAQNTYATGVLYLGGLAGEVNDAAGRLHTGRNESGLLTISASYVCAGRLVGNLATGAVVYNCCYSAAVTNPGFGNLIGAVNGLTSGATSTLTSCDQGHPVVTAP